MLKVVTCQYICLQSHMGRGGRGGKGQQLLDYNNLLVPCILVEEERQRQGEEERQEREKEETRETP